MLRLVYDNAAMEADFQILYSGAVRYVGDPTPLGYDKSHTLDTAIIASLFTDRRAAPTDHIPEGSHQGGCWIDSYPEVEGDIWGSRLWTLVRAKVTNATLREAREMCEEALAWLIEDGVASHVEVETDWIRGKRGHLGIRVKTYKPGSVSPQYSGPWEIFYDVV